MSENNTTVLPSVQVCGVQVHALRESECVAWIGDELAQGRGGWVVTANLDHLRRLVVDGSYAGLCAGATLLVADGMPLIWASRLQGTPLPERVAGSDLISSLTEMAAAKGKSVFLLGGDAGTAEKAAAVLCQRYPNLRVAGTYCPPWGFEDDAAEHKKIVDAVAKARPDIVYVALGSPKQERLIESLRWSCPGAWWMGVGISFSFLCGEVHRAPRWLQRLGLEWLCRLVGEPRRLGRRYLIEGLPFAARLLASAAMRRLGMVRAKR